jgi:hypothetical protein
MMGSELTERHCTIQRPREDVGRDAVGRTT